MSAERGVGGWLEIRGLDFENLPADGVPRQLEVICDNPLFASWVEVNPPEKQTVNPDLVKFIKDIKFALLRSFQRVSIPIPELTKEEAKSILRQFDESGVSVPDNFAYGLSIKEAPHWAAERAILKVINADPNIRELIYYRRKTQAIPVIRLEEYQTSFCLPEEFLRETLLTPVEVAAFQSTYARFALKARSKFRRVKERV